MEIYEILDKYYYKNLPIDVNKVKSVEELLSFTDDYTYTFSTTRNIDMGNKYVGLGITIQDHQDGLLLRELMSLRKLINIFMLVMLSQVLMKKI